MKPGSGRKTRKDCGGLRQNGDVKDQLNSGRWPTKKGKTMKLTKYVKSIGWAALDLAMLLGPPARAQWEANFTGQVTDITDPDGIFQVLVTAGTPETDHYGDNPSGEAHCVTIPEPGSTPMAFLMTIDDTKTSCRRKSLRKVIFSDVNNCSVSPSEMRWCENSRCH
jgi:hypothetical protein